MKAAATLMIAPIALAACVPQTPAPAPAERPLATSCNDNAVRTLVGEAVSPGLVASAQKRAGARSVRVIRPGQAVTMDYRTDRLNIELDENDRITALRCG